MTMNPLNQNPHQHNCVICGDLADELYEGDWMCEDCIVDREMNEE
jgi:NMD protein affecting ribosome stability and mRNA decay